MATLACVFVFQCDGCGVIRTCQNEAEHVQFMKEWHDMTSQFCPSCKVKPEIIVRIDQEQVLWHAAVRRHIDRRPDTQEVAHVH